MIAASPGQLLIALVSEAADAALASSTLAGRDIDRAAFMARNRAALLTVIASQQTLRAQLANKYADQLTSAQCRHPLLDDLLSADPAMSTAAAERLGSDPTALAPSPAPPTRPQQPAPRPARATATTDGHRTCCVGSSRSAHTETRPAGNSSTPSASCARSGPNVIRPYPTATRRSPMPKRYASSSPPNAPAPPPWPPTSGTPRLFSPRP